MNDVDAILRRIGCRRGRSSRRLTWFGQAVCDLDDPRAHEHLTAAVYQFAYIVGSPAPIEPAINRGLDLGWHDLQPDERLASRWSGWTYTPAGTLEALGQPRIKVDSLFPRESASDVAVALPSMSLDALPGWIVKGQQDLPVGGQWNCPSVAIRIAH